MASRPLPAAIRALSHRDFRYYFCGHAISILGSWIQQVAMSWLVYRLTGSAVLLGVTAFAALIPQLVIGPLAGAWIDKQDKRRWLIGVQTVLALQALLLAFLTMAHLVTPSLLVAMSLVLGVVNSFDAPLRQSLIGRFVGDPADLPNAHHAFDVLGTLRSQLTASAVASFLGITYARHLASGEVRQAV